MKNSDATRIPSVAYGRRVSSTANAGSDGIRGAGRCLAPRGRLTRPDRSIFGAR
jgi:hypothetical protein